jgi:hypothetical protein
MARLSRHGASALVSAGLGMAVKARLRKAWHHLGGAAGGQGSVGGALCGSVLQGERGRVRRLRYGAVPSAWHVRAV